MRADLHLHSCLSPCGSLDNSPAALVDQAARLGIGAIALTDHNTCGNCGPFLNLCSDAGLQGIPGLEVTTAEEVHVLCLFEELPATQEFQEWLWADLPRYGYDPLSFGDQARVNEDNEILDIVPFYLGAASPKGIETIAARVIDAGGMAIPAHVDRSSMSLGANLGFVPDFPFTGLEALSLPPGLDPRGSTVIRNSDCHRIEDLGRRGTYYDVRSAGFCDLRDAILAGRVEDAPAIHAGAIR